jgi:prevent-host-death family protein
LARTPKLSRDIRPLSEFRANTAKFVRHVQETGRPLVLTQHGRGAAVLLDITEYEKLVERSELADDIRTAEAQLDRDEGVDQTTAKKAALKRLAKK